MIADFDKEQLEEFGELLVDVLDQLLGQFAGEEPGVARARIFEVVTAEEAGRVAVERLEQIMTPLVLSSLQISAGRGKRVGEAAGAVEGSVRRWMGAQGPEFAFPMLFAIEELAASRIAGTA